MNATIAKAMQMVHIVNKRIDGRPGFTLCELETHNPGDGRVYKMMHAKTGRTLVYARTLKAFEYGTTAFINGWELGIETASKIDDVKKAALSYED